MTESVVHIAGLVIEVGPLLRQRCAFCGHVLIDYNLQNVAVSVGDGEGRASPATWQVGSLVEVGGTWPVWSTALDHKDGDRLPENSCVPRLSEAKG